MGEKVQKEMLAAAWFFVRHWWAHAGIFETLAHPLRSKVYRFATGPEKINV